MGKYCAQFLGMLQSFDDLMGINDSPSPAIIQTGDLVFISETIEGSGFIGVVDEGDGKPSYQRVYIDGNNVQLCTMSHSSGMHEVSRDTVKITGRVTGFYRKLDDAPLPDDGWKDMAIFKAISKVRVDKYDMTLQSIFEIIKKNQGDPERCIDDAFRYGFLKGQRAEKAKNKKKLS